MQLDERIQRVLENATTISEDELAAQTAAETRERAAEKRAEWVTAFRAAVPDRVRDVVLAGVDETRTAARVAGAWVREPPTEPHLVLRGEERCGKTVAAAYAAWLFLEPQPGPPRRVAFLHPDRLVDLTFHSYRPDLPLLEQMDLVIVDDVGTEDNRPRFQTALRLLLDQADTRVLMTTNLRKAAMREHYDSRLIRRLRETARAVDLPSVAMEALPDHGDF